MKSNSEKLQSSVLNEKQIHQCKDISGFCMKIDCDQLIYCQLCYKKFHSKHSKYCNQIENVQQLLHNKLNDYQQQVEVVEILQQKVQSINQFFKSIIETQQNEINQILQWIKDQQSNKIQNKAQQNFKLIYYNKDIKCIFSYMLAKIINLEFKQYIEQITDIETQWNSKVQLLMNQKEKIQKIYFISDDSDFSSSSSSEIMIDRQEEIEQDSFKIKQFVCVQKDLNYQQDLQEIQEQKNDQQINNEQQQQQQQVNASDEDYSWKLVLSENLINDAKELLSQDNNNQALQLVNESLELFPNNIEALELKGFLLVLLKKYQEAIIVCEQAIKLNKNSFISHEIKCQSLFFLDRFQEAILCCDELIPITPNQAQAYLDKSICLAKLQKYEQAIDIAKKIPENNNNIKVKKILQIGECLYHLHQYEEALKFTSQGIEIDQTNAKLHTIHSFILIYLQKYETALIFLEALPIQQWQFLLLQSAILRWLKRFDEALEKCRQAENIHSMEWLIQSEKNLILNRNSEDQKILLSFQP